MSKTLTKSSVREAMLDPNKHKLFLATAGWTFDPTELGFAIIKFTRQGGKFWFYAEHTVRSRRRCVTFQVRKKNSDNYIVRKETTNYSGNDWNERPRMWDCVLPNKTAAVAMCKELKIFSRQAFSGS